MSPQYRVVEARPSVDDYVRLRHAAGLGRRSREAAERGLSGGLYAVVVEAKSGGRDWTAVGMGRIVGDGGCFFQIVDMAVDPDHQGNGLGARIMDALVTWLDDQAPDTAYISLIADAGVAPFYEKFGFVARPPDAPGMSYDRQRNRSRPA